jgi:hypothetical protein
VTTAVVLGGADCLWDDLRALDGPPEIVVAVNNAGIVYPGRLDHWATMHAEEMPWREAKRRAKGYPGGYIRWTHPTAVGWDDHTETCDRFLDGWSDGSSGWFGVGVALEVADRAILCGIPMDERPHFDRVAGWDVADAYFREWEKRLDRVQGRVFSMSGRTRDLLGPPPTGGV